MDQLDIYYRALLDYRRAVGSSADHKAFIKAITQAVERGSERIVVKHPICKVDEDWIVAIEEGLVHIERAIKEERQFITSNGEVVPIEKVKQVSRESVQHLARHSNLISREPEEDGDIIPDGLYTLERLNDYTVYENRFLYMLLCYLRDFVTLRYNKIEALSTQYEGKLEISRELVQAKRKLSYTVTMHDERSGDKYLRERGSAKEIIKRLSYILDAIHAYLSTPLMESASKAAMLKPPITKTNVLKMDKNFKGAVALYDFIIAYDKDGYEVDDRERVLSPFESELATYSADMIATVAFLMYEYGLDLGESFHDRSDFVTEEVAKVIDGICGILHYIMEQGRYDGFISKTDIAHYDLGHCDRVKYVWLSGASSDAFVSFIGKIECLLDHVQLRLVIAAFAGRFLEVRIVSRNDFMVMRCEL